MVIASGAGNLDHIKSLIKSVNPSGIAIASLLHFQKTTIKEIKNYLSESKVGGY